MKTLTLSAFKNSLVSITENGRNKTYLLAVSGGADSMVLLHLMKELEYDFHAAHVNYKLRGEDSDLDQKIAEDFCKKYLVPFHLYTVSDAETKPSGSVQLWARALRYDFFRKIMNDNQLDFLMTAHHLNDQLETFIINLSRGSGIRGLSGIPQSDNGILRPLLQFPKEEIYRFAKEKQVPFREDLSNQKNDYLRNEIRNQIVPLLIGTNPNFLENFQTSLSLLSDSRQLMENKLEEIADEMTTFSDENILLNKSLFSGQSLFVQSEILRKYGFLCSDEIQKIMKAENGKIFFSNKYRLLVDHDTLVITEKKNVEKKESILDIAFFHAVNISENEIFTFQNDDFQLKMQLTDRPTSLRDKNEWLFDFEKLNFPLKIRKANEKDLIFPIGMIGKKKLSKFFRDEKIPILAREKIWLLCNGNDEVLGVIPFRQDRRYAADSATNAFLKISIQIKNEF